MARGRRIITFFRQRDWPGAFFELLVVAIGVLLGISASNWNDSRIERQRTGQIVEALRQDLRDGIAVEQKAGADIDAGLAGFAAARRRGERPVPFVYRIPGAENAPGNLWDAALQTGLGDSVDPDLVYDLGFFYSERQGIGARFAHYARFVEDDILPYAHDPSHFYDANGALKPEFAANMERLREFRSFIAVTVRTAQCLDKRFAMPSQPGRSCRASYGDRFTPDSRA
jgi:hypothetical protein